MKFSRRQLAQVFVALSQDVSWQELVPVVAELLTINRRQREVGLFVQDVAKAWHVGKGEVFAQAVSAHRLTKQAREHLVGYMKEQTGSSTVHLREKIDPEVLGGAVVQTPTHTYDMSARRFLDAIIKSAN
jgi:F0F1-type ATP synthase delta subunit